jgi:hypothetical protein
MHILCRVSPHFKSPSTIWPCPTESILLGCGPVAMDQFTAASVDDNDAVGSCRMAADWHMPGAGRVGCGMVRVACLSVLSLRQGFLCRHTVDWYSIVITTCLSLPIGIRILRHVAGSDGGSQPDSGLTAAPEAQVPRLPALGQHSRTAATTELSVWGSACPCVSSPSTTNSDRMLSRSSRIILFSSIVPWNQTLLICRASRKLGLSFAVSRDLSISHSRPIPDTRDLLNAARRAPRPDFNMRAVAMIFVMVLLVLQVSADLNSEPPIVLCLLVHQGAGLQLVVPSRSFSCRACARTLY